MNVTCHRASGRLWRSALTAAIALSGIAASTAALASPLSAPKATPTLTLNGPSSNKVGASFRYVISGTATHTANFVVAWEQFDWGQGCAATYAGESTRALLPGTYSISLWVPGPSNLEFGERYQSAAGVTGKYTVTTYWGADNSGKHGICAYLINLSTGVTYAHAGAFWVNHS